MKKPKKSVPIDAFGRTQLQALVGRLEAMELREAATREQVRLASSAVNDAKAATQIVGELRASLQVVFETIANFDALIRPIAKKLFAQGQIERYYDIRKTRNRRKR